MALVGNMIASSFAGNPATVNYSMYVSAFSMFSLFYLVPASWNLDWALHPIIMVVVDVLNCVFFFCAAIALAAKLTCHSCSNHVRCCRFYSFRPCRGIFTNYNSLIWSATKLQTARTTCRSAVARLKRLWLSCGLAGLDTWPPSSSPC